MVKAVIEPQKVEVHLQAPVLQGQVQAMVKAVLEPQRSSSPYRHQSCRARSRQWSRHSSSPRRSRSPHRHQSRRARSPSMKRSRSRGRSRKESQRKSGRGPKALPKDKLEGLRNQDFTCRPKSRAPDKFNPFKPYLKTTQILADNLWLQNAKIYNNLSVFVSLSMSVSPLVWGQLRSIE